MYANLTDPVLQNYTDSIKSFVYMTENIFEMYDDSPVAQISQQSRMLANDAIVVAVNPSSLVDDNLMLNYYDQDTELGMTEQLYTARGS